MLSISQCSAANILALDGCMQTSLSWFSPTFVGLRSMMRRIAVKCKPPQREIYPPLSLRRSLSSLTGAALCRGCVIAVAFFACGLSASAQTANLSRPPYGGKADWCAWPSTIQVLPGLVDANTSHVILSDSAGFRMSHKALNDWAKRFVNCRPGPDREAAAGYFNSWQAILLHSAADSRWREKINLANQQLASCVVNYHGTDRGAECETRLETNVRLKATWEMSSERTDQ